MHACMNAVGKLFWQSVKPLQTSKIDRYETAKFNMHLKLLRLKYAKKLMQENFLTRHYKVHKIAAQKISSAKSISSMKIVQEYLDSQFIKKIHLGSGTVCYAKHFFILFSKVYNNEHQYLIKKGQF